MITVKNQKEINDATYFEIDNKKIKMLFPNRKDFETLIGEKNDKYDADEVVLTFNGVSNYRREERNQTDQKKRKRKKVSSARREIVFHRNLLHANKQELFSEMFWVISQFFLWEKLG